MRKYMHGTERQEGFVLLAALPLLLGAVVSLAAVSFCFYQGTKLTGYHDRLMEAYAFLEEDFSCEGKEVPQPEGVFLSGALIKKEFRQKVGPYLLLQKTILRAGTDTKLVNRIEFVSEEEETPHDP